MAKDSLAKDHKVVLEYLVTSVGTMGTTHGSAEQLCSVSWVVHQQSIMSLEKLLKILILKDGF